MEIGREKGNFPIFSLTLSAVRINGWLENKDVVNVASWPEYLRSIRSARNEASHSVRSRVANCNVFRQKVLNIVLRKLGNVCWWFFRALELFPIDMYNRIDSPPFGDARIAHPSRPITLGCIFNRVPCRSFEIDTRHENKLACERSLPVMEFRVPSDFDAVSRCDCFAWGPESEFSVELLKSWLSIFLCGFLA